MQIFKIETILNLYITSSYNMKFLVKLWAANDVGLKYGLELLECQ